MRPTCLLDATVIRRSDGVCVVAVWLVRRCRDYIGSFVVGIHGTQEKSEKFMEDHDDFSKIMLHALADR